MAANPVLLVDEIDKAAASQNGDAKATLLSMLEIETARSWFDACLLVPADVGLASVLDSDTINAFVAVVIVAVALSAPSLSVPDAVKVMTSACAAEAAMSKTLAAIAV